MNGCLLHLEYPGLFSLLHTSSPGAAAFTLNLSPLSGLNPHFLADLDCLLIYWAWTVAHWSLCPYHTLDGVLENKLFKIKIDYFVGATVQWLAHTCDWSFWVISCSRSLSWSYTHMLCGHFLQHNWRGHELAF